MKTVAWKGIFFDRSIHRIMNRVRHSARTKISGRSGKRYKAYIEPYTRSRRSSIPLMLVGRTVRVYNGKQYVGVHIRRWMMNHKFGEFVTTKKLGPGIHDSLRNRKRRAKAKHK